jgi:3-methyl-2-oxobutanoate hydroxymethyltransferase
MADEAMARQGKTLTLSVFSRRKRDGNKLVVLTAYDLTSALIAAAGGVDAILVGDSVGMVVLGHDNTLPVTMADMVHHCRAVVRARPRVPVIVDMPYGSFHVSPEATVANALRLSRAAADERLPEIDPAPDRAISHVCKSLKFKGG